MGPKQGRQGGDDDAIHWLIEIKIASTHTLCTRTIKKSPQIPYFQLLRRVLTCVLRTLFTHGVYRRWPVNDQGTCLCIN